MMKNIDLNARISNNKTKTSVKWINLSGVCSFGEVYGLKISYN